MSPGSTSALLRHFADLRDGTHGGASSRADKERLYAAAVPLLDPHARQALEEINTDLLLGTGEVSATGVRPSADGGHPQPRLPGRWGHSHHPGHRQGARLAHRREG